MSQTKGEGLEADSELEPVPVPLPFAQSPGSGSATSSGSGSSITSFDSNNLIDDKRQATGPHLQDSSAPSSTSTHLQHSQQQSHSRIQAKDTAGPYPIPIHRPEPVENHLEAANGLDGGVESVFGTPMYFGTENSTVVTTQIGATAHVPCTVHHIGEGVVSQPHIVLIFYQKWIHHRRIV